MSELKEQKGEEPIDGTPSNDEKSETEKLSERLEALEARLKREGEVKNADADAHRKLWSAVDGIKGLATGMGPVGFGLVIIGVAYTSMLLDIVMGIQRTLERQIAKSK